MRKVDYDAKMVCADYFFAESIRLLNDVRRSHGEPILTTRMARNLRQAFVDNYNQIRTNETGKYSYVFPAIESTKRKEGASVEQRERVMSALWMFGLADAFNMTIRELNGDTDFYYSRNEYKDSDITSGWNSSAGGATVSYNDSRHILGALYVSFSNMTDWRIYDMWDENPGQKPDGFYPISPYDPTFSHRKAVLDNGGTVLWVPQEDVLKDNGTMLDIHSKAQVAVQSYDMFAPFVHSLDDSQDMDWSSVDRDRITSLSYLTVGYRENRRNLVLYEEEDAKGLSVLRPYMTDEEYRTVSSHVLASEKELDENRAEEDSEKSRQLLEFFNTLGYEYQVVPDLYPGQLKIYLPQSKSSVRLLDIGNSNYIGKFYRDGYQVYYQQNKDPRFKYDVDIPDMFNMIRYMLGEKVPMNSYNSDLEVPQQGNQLHVRRSGDQMLKDESGLAYIGGRSVVQRGNFLTEKTYFELPQKPADGYGMQYILADVEAGKIQTRNGRPLYRLCKDKGLVINGASHTSNVIDFTVESPEKFLRDAITTAKENYRSQLNLDYLIAEHLAHPDDLDYKPIFAESGSISLIQQQYWDVLRGKVDLNRWDVTEDEINEELELEQDAEELNLTDLMDLIFTRPTLTYEGTPEDQIRAHLEDTLEHVFGSFEPDENGKRFNAALTATYMSSSASIFRNMDNVVAASRALSFQGDEFRGEDTQTDFMRDQLLYFNEETAHRLGGEDASDFMKLMEQAIVDTVTTSLCTISPENILIDDKGVVRYTADRFVKNTDGTVRTQQVTGYLGQIFEPDKETGVVETRYAGSPNRIFTPGYKLTVLPQDETHPVRLVDRLRAKGYEHDMQEAIRSTLRLDLMDYHDSLGGTTSLNSVYSRLQRTIYKVRVPQEGKTLLESYLEENREQMPEEVIQARFRSNQLSFRFPTKFRDNAGLTADYNYMQDYSSDMPTRELMKDNDLDPFKMMDCENIAVLGEQFDGFFDPVATGAAKNQGVTRYGVEGLTVDPLTGRLRPAMKEDGSIDREARAPIMMIEGMKYKDNVPSDRQQMAQSNIMTAIGVTRMGIAYMSCGYSYDDASTIRKDVAEKLGPIVSMGEKQTVVLENGEETEVETGPIRSSLQIGDKVCEFSGNKNTIGVIIDPDISDEEFAKLPKINQDLVKLYRDNPDLMMTAPSYSPMGRFNAASMLFAMEDNFEVKLPDGSTTYGGYVPMMITYKRAEDGTHEYGTEAVLKGRGRSGSGQLNWILGAMGAFNLMDEMYGPNDAAIATYREYLISMGLDIDQNGHLRYGYHAHKFGEETEKRNVFYLPAQDELDKMAMDDKSLLKAFETAIDNKGGFLEIPFVLKLKSGSYCPKLKANQNHSGLPVLSSHLRSGQDFDDGISRVHDYTKQYATIYINSVRYLRAEADNNKPEMAKCRGKIERAYTSIADDLQSRVFEGKHNFIRDKMMARRLPNSATAVWTPNPYCALDEVRMSSSMAKTLGKKEGEYVLGWRDPCLHWSSAMAMKVAIDDSVVGVQVNPLMEVRMDGDNDGDSIGLYGVSSKKGKKDLEEKMSMYNNLLDFTHKDPDTGNYALFVNRKMDVASIIAREEEARAKMMAEGKMPEGPSFNERWTALEQKANDVYQKRPPYENLTFEEASEVNKGILDDLSTWCVDVFEYDSIGAQCLSMKDVPSMVQDLEQMVKDKAKGKIANIGQVLRYMGVDYELGVKQEVQADGTVVDVEYYDPNSFTQYDHTLATREDIINTEKATAIKSGGTPFAGMFSIAGMATCRNLGVKASPDDPSVIISDQQVSKNLLDLSYYATQSALQAKHDSIMAIQRFGVLQGPLKSMWDSKPVIKVEHYDKKLGCEVKDWVSVDSQNHLTTKEWFDQFMRLHNDADGMNLEGDVNPEQVWKIARALTNPQTGEVFGLGTTDAFEALASPMDVLGYYPSFDKLLDFAKRKADLFAGPVTYHLAPNAIKEGKGFAHGDVLDREKVKGAGYQGNRAQKTMNREGYNVTVSRRRMRTDEMEQRVTSQAVESSTGKPVSEETNTVKTVSDSNGVPVVPVSTKESTCVAERSSVPISEENGSSGGMNFA